MNYLIHERFDRKLRIFRSWGAAVPALPQARTPLTMCSTQERVTLLVHVNVP